MNNKIIIRKYVEYLIEELEDIAVQYIIKANEQHDITEKHREHINAHKKLFGIEYQPQWIIDEHNLFLKSFDEEVKLTTKSIENITKIIGYKNTLTYFQGGDEEQYE